MIRAMILPARCESPGLNGRNRTRDWSGLRTMLVRLRLIALFDITVPGAFNLHELRSASPPSHGELSTEKVSTT